MYNPYEAKMTMKSKMLFATGSFGSGFLYTMVTSFYMYFLTQVQGLSGTVVGTFFLFALLWDAVNDPIMGAIVTNTKSRFGKYRIWIIIGSVLTAVCLILMFINSGLPIQQRYEYYLTLYIIWGTVYTLVDIPYWSLIPVMTKNENERSSISSLTQIFSSSATVLISTLMPIVLLKFWGSQTNPTGYIIIAVLVSIVFLATMLVTAFSINEKRTLIDRKYSIKSMFFAFKKNDQAISLFLPLLLLNVAFGLILNLGIYYFSFDFGDPTKQSIFMIIAGIGMAFAVLSYTKITKNLGRKFVFVLSCTLCICGFFLMFFFNEFMHGNIAYLSMAALVALTGFGWINVARAVMTASICDYAFKKTGQRMDSLWVSILSFSGKVGNALVSLLIGLVLDIGGFVGKNPQVDTVSVYGINVLRLTMFIVPAILVVLALVSYLKFYRLDNKKITYRFARQERPKKTKRKTKKTVNTVVNQKV